MQTLFSSTWKELGEKRREEREDNEKSRKGAMEKGRGGRTRKGREEGRKVSLTDHMPYDRLSVTCSWLFYIDAHLTPRSSLSRGLQRGFHKLTPRGSTYTLFILSLSGLLQLPGDETPRPTPLLPYVWVLHLLLQLNTGSLKQEAEVVLPLFFVHLMSSIDKTETYKHIRFSIHIYGVIISSSTDVF